MTLYFLSFVFSGFVKQFFVILSSIIFLFGAAGYYFAFIIADNHMRNEMIQTIQSAYHKPNVIQLSFSKIELRKEVRFTNAGQREFIYRSRLYDVIKTQDDGDRISFTCAADEKETSLFTEFGKQQTEQSSGNSTTGKSSAKPLMQDWFFQNNFSEHPVATSAIIFPNEVCFLSKLSFRIPSPPPKA